jgi:4-amino-4-deoxy-L-arabinose transferase-like glycosyltransferase
VECPKEERLQTSDDSASADVVRILPRSRLKLPLAMSGLAVLLSLFFSLVIFPHFQEPLNLNIDPDRVGELGANIYRGKGFIYNESSSPAVDRGPTYPYLLAGIFWLTGGVRFTAIQIFQAACHGLTCFLIFLAAHRIFERRVAIIALLLCSVHPMLIWYTARIWIETINTLATMIILLAIVLMSERLTFPRSIGAGAIMGIAALTKSIIILFPFVAAIYFFLRWRKESLPHVLLMILSTVLLVVPWTLRNHAVSGELVPVHTSLGLNLIQGDAIGEYWTKKPYSTIELWRIGKHKIDSLLSGSQHTATDPIGDRMLMRSSWSHSLSHPLFFVKRALANFVTFWYLSESKMKSLFLVFIQGPMLLCVIFVSVLLWNKNPMIWPALLLIGYYAVCHSLVFGWARFSVPIIPACLLFVAYALVEIHRKFRRRRLLPTPLA